MQKFLTDVHTHSTFSFDGVDTLDTMLKTAHEKGVAFYGVAEHFNYDSCEAYVKELPQDIDQDGYFHKGRHLQDDYAGCMNVLIGAEFGFTFDEKAIKRYLEVYEKYRPDFVVNSIHNKDGWDYYTKKPYYTADGTLKDKKQAYGEYLQLVKQSLDAPYPYDIVAHIGYCIRYAPYDDVSITLAEFGAEIDEILKGIIQRDKILEVNSGYYGGLCLPTEEILRRYYVLGGRKLSFASDAHDAGRILDKREEIVDVLKKIGFTYIIVPCRGEHIKVEL
ncbi:MAG: histidinol-phosphatase HisJ family protein [Clostridia bacterium]|nr:histidinol-phosphatase HisJ family protein [Clostridia bacterium]